MSNWMIDVNNKLINHYENIVARIDSEKPLTKKMKKERRDYIVKIANCRKDIEQIHAMEKSKSGIEERV